MDTNTTATTVITDPAEAERIVAEAAPYTEWVLEWECLGTVRELRLMARDTSRPGRRCTDLTHGTEWMGVSAESLRRLGFVALRTL